VTAGQAVLVKLCAQECNVPSSGLPSFLRALQEGGVREWNELSERSPRGATLAAAAMTSHAIPGLVRPKIVDKARNTPPGRSLQVGAAAVAGTNQICQAIVDQILAVVPWPADLDAVGEVLDLFGEDRYTVPRQLVSAISRVSGESQDTSGGGLAAARALTAESGEAVELAERLLANGELPAWLFTLCQVAAMGESGRRRMLEPIMIAAKLPEPIAGLLPILVDLLGNHPANWRSIRPVVKHLERLADVSEFVGIPTLQPSTEALRRLRIDLELATRYDRQLLFEIEEEGGDPASIRRFMKGFSLFCDLLQAALDFGAPIDYFPRGVANLSSTNRWQGMRPDLTPEPSGYLQLLALAPFLLREEQPAIARLILLDLVIPSRPNVILTLERRAWIEEPEGVVFHVRPGARHKRGRAAVFLANSFRELYQISPSWLPVSADEQPSHQAIAVYRAAFVRLLEEFRATTGIELPTQQYLSRRGLVQILRGELSYPEISVVTAFLDHDSPRTRANYLRPTRTDMLDALDRL